jgi:hypothetical protein
VGRLTDEFDRLDSFPEQIRDLPNRSPFLDVQPM